MNITEKVFYRHLSDWLAMIGVLKSILPVAEQLPPILRNPFKESQELRGRVLTQPYLKRI